MKIKDIISEQKQIVMERMDEHDRILHGLLKIVAHMKKTGYLPFGKYRQSKKFGGRLRNRVHIWSLLDKVGVDTPYDIEQRFPETQKMAKEVQYFIDAVTVGSNENIEIKDVAPLAKTIYDWSRAMQDREYMTL